MKYVLTTPQSVGDMGSQTVIDYIQVASIGINFEPVYLAKGGVVVSITLIHPGSGRKWNFVYKGAVGLAIWQALDGVQANIQHAVLTKLSNDSKLPAGTIQP